METPVFVTYSVELTDTFGREPNYSWVRRNFITVNSDMGVDAMLRKAAKRVGCYVTDSDLARWESVGDGYAIYFDDDNTVLFVNYWNDSETSPDEYEAELGRVVNSHDSAYDYSYEHGGLTVATPSGTCLLQGDEASELYELLEANPLDIVRILSEYEHICE